MYYYFTVHLDSNHALLYSKAHKTETYLLIIHTPLTSENFTFTSSGFTSNRPGVTIGKPEEKQN